MSEHLDMIGGHERVAYTVEHRGRCVLIAGAVPATALSVLAGLVPEGSVMGSDAARLLGVTFAFGPGEELDALKEGAAEAALRRERSRNPGPSEAAVKWLAGGKRGISSETIFTHLTGIDALGDWRKDHPHDPADFRRCRLLLEQVPELVPLFPRMAEVSPQWATLVEQWDTICATMDAEAPNWRDGKGQIAPKTYDLIKSAIGRK